MTKAHSYARTASHAPWQPEKQRAKQFLANLEALASFLGNYAIGLAVTTLVMAYFLQMGLSDHLIGFQERVGESTGLKYHKLALGAFLVDDVVRGCFVLSLAAMVLAAYSALQGGRGSLIRAIDLLGYSLGVAMCLSVLVNALPLMKMGGMPPVHGGARASLSTWLVIENYYLGTIAWDLALAAALSGALVARSTIAFFHSVLPGRDPMLGLLALLMMSPALLSFNTTSMEAVGQFEPMPMFGYAAMEDVANAVGPASASAGEEQGNL